RVSITYRPMAEMPWDSVLLDMVGRATNISVPVALKPTPDYRNTVRDSTHVYEADVLLRDVDTFAPRGFIEYRDGKWNPESGLPIEPYRPESLLIDDKLAVEVSDADGSNPFSLERYLDLPLCTEPDAEGRWVHAETLPFSAAEVPPADNHNMVWLPYSCRLRRVSYAELADCMTTHHQRIHWFGDSNTRRALKKIVTLGQWCTEEEDLGSRACLCEDGFDKNFTRFNVWVREQIIDMTSEGGQALTTPLADYRAVPDKTARIYMYKWDGLTSRNRPPWPTLFEKGVVAHYGHPSVAIISLANWDAAFSSHVEFAVQLDLLLELLEREYTPSTKFIIRTGQYYCCRTDATVEARQYTRLRNAYFSDYVNRAFRERFGATRRVAVWDVASLSERLPLSTRKEADVCNSNHPRAEIIEVENQLLYNAMCNIAPGTDAPRAAPSADGAA
ncbi:hypothetical protein IWQ57_004202, partial [Coemansia nantahalensis]